MHMQHPPPPPKLTSGVRPLRSPVVRNVALSGHTSTSHHHHTLRSLDQVHQLLQLLMTNRGCCWGCDRNPRSPGMLLLLLLLLVLLVVVIVVGLLLKIVCSCCS